MSHNQDFSDYVSKYHADVFAAAMGILRNPEDASDVTQQVFMAVAEGRLDMDAAKDPRALLRWSAGKHSLSHLRSEQRRRRREEVHAMESTTGAEVEFSDEELRSLWNAVAALPEQLSSALVLRFRENLSFESIGETLACSKGTAFERVKQGLQRLKQRLPQGAVGLTGLESALRSSPQTQVPLGLEQQLLRLGQSVQASAGVASASVMGTSAFLVWAGGAAAVALVAFGLGVWPFAGEVANEVPSLPDRKAEVALRETLTTAGAESAHASERLNTQPFEASANDLPSRPAVSTGPLVAQPLPMPKQIMGRVVDERNAPIENARVMLRSVAMKGKAHRVFLETQTNADGVFTLQGAINVRDLRCSLSITRSSFVPYHHPKRLKLEQPVLDLGRIAMKPVALAARVRWSAEVRVLDEASMPLANAEVTVSREMEADEIPGVTVVVSKGRTDENGYAQVHGGRGGVLEISAHGEGFARETQKRTVDGPGPFQWSIQLKPGWSLRGVVVDTHGQPLNRSLVSMKVGTDLRRAWTKTDGRFELLGLGAPPWTLHAMGIGKSEASLHEVGPKPAGLRIVLKDQDDPRDIGMHDAELHGWWTHPESGAKLPLKQASSHAKRIPDGASLADWLPLQLTPRVVQTASGMFERAPRDDAWHHTGLKPGNYIVMGERWREGFVVGGPYTLGRSSVLSELRIPLARQREVSGMVLNPQGEPVPNAELFPVGHGPLSEALVARRDKIVMEEGGQGGRHWGYIAKSDDEGRFKLKIPAHLPENIPLYLTAIHAEYAPATPLVVSRDNSNAFELRLAAR